MERVAKPLNSLIRWHGGLHRPMILALNAFQNFKKGEHASSPLQRLRINFAALFS